MKTIKFGIDCDPFCRYQEHFQKEAERILGRSIEARSKLFGCWDYKEAVTEKQHEQIAKTLIRYYNDGLCRGCMCDNLKHYM